MNPLNVELQDATPFVSLKSLFLAIREASKNWKQIHHWKPALQSFQVMFGEERVPLAAL